MSTTLDCASITDATLQTFCYQVVAQEEIRQLELDTLYILWAGVLVFFMHAGFAMLSAGAVRMKNTLNILMCILLDAAMCGIAFWFCGFAFAYGEDKGGFIGASYFVGIGIGQPGNKQYFDWFFQYAFAATSATIVSGAVAERATFEAYISYSFLLSFWIYPVCVHWIWGGGFLTLGDAAFNGVGCLDFAGDGPVHALGGICGAIGSKIIGPRIGRFNADGSANVIQGHSSPLAMLGTFILWVGWFGFNAGSAGVLTFNGSILAQRAAMNTLLASATGALASLCTSTILKGAREWDLGAALNGTLAGLVAITGSCAVVETWAALVIGALGGVVYIGASRFCVDVLKIDDPLDATAVHFFVGSFGLFMVGFFANPDFVAEYGTFTTKTAKDYAGVMYAGNGTLLLGQLIEFLCICGWAFAFITPYFLFLKYTGWLRVSVEVEEAGIDSSTHGGHAYPEHATLEKDVVGRRQTVTATTDVEVGTVSYQAGEPAADAKKDI